LALRLHERSLRPRAFLGTRYEEVALVAETEVRPLVEVIEEGDALAHQLDLFGVVEL
jgi:hypothetical protein